MNVDREARLREVLAEVSLLDLWAATKGIFAQWGCLAVFLAISALVGQVPTAITGSSEGFGIPDWLIWFAIIWIAIAAYTETKSYHEHRFAWYFPKAGFFWSIPLACYLMAGIQFFRIIDPEADGWARAGQLALAAAWRFPVFLMISLLEIGHNRLMDKRTSEAQDSIS